MPASRTIPADGPVRQVEGIASATPDRRIRPRPSPRGAARASGPRRSRPERDERPVRGANSRIGRQHHPAMELVGPDPGEVEGGAPAALDAVDGRPVDLDLADPHVAVAGHEPERVARAQRPAPERARDDRATALDREDPVDRQRRRTGRRPVRRRRRASAARTSSSPSPSRPDAARTGEPASDVGARSSVTAATTAPTRSGSTASILVTTTIPGRDPERVEQRQVFERLGAWAVVGGHDQHRGVDLARPRRACCRPACRAPGTSTKSIDGPVVERRGGHTRHRSSSRAGAPRAAGRRRCRSAPAAAWSCRDRCARPCR